MYYYYYCLDPKYSYLRKISSAPLTIHVFNFSNLHSLAKCRRFSTTCSVYLNTHMSFRISSLVTPFAKKYANTQCIHIRNNCANQLISYEYLVLVSHPI